MTTDYNLLKIWTLNAERVRHHRIIRYVLIIANLIIWGMALLLLQSCEPAVEPVREFLVRKGEYYSVPRVSETLQSQKLIFDARFNESAVYDLGDPAVQCNKNKLMGFCDCNSLVHENSARFAWQWNNNRLEIYGYCYANGVRAEQFVGVAPLNEYSHYELEIKGNSYVFTLNNEAPVSMKRGTTSGVGFYYKLWPYFGGDIAAPHDVTIDIKAIY